MLGVIVTFQYDEGSFDRKRIEGLAEQAHPSFRGLAGLRLKAFTVDEENRRAVNVYLWDSDDAATSFFGDDLRKMVTGPLRRGATHRLRRDRRAGRQHGNACRALTEHHPAGRPRIIPAADVRVRYAP